MKFFKADNYYNVNCIETVYNKNGYLYIKVSGQEIKLFHSYNPKDTLNFCKWLNESDSDILYMSTFVDNWL